MLRISMITLGVKDVAASTAFYEALGLAKSGASQEAVTFFEAGPCVLGLFGREALAEDGNAGELWSGNGGFSVAYNVPSKEAVEKMIAKADEIGATILKTPQDVFWGGYHGYFADPDGHIWEIAYNPFFPVSEDGAVTLP
ncbi:MAG TPA: VOC family protein [Hyphomicrobiales bacterium]|nr:VOC family protein [Hyphomicrobiales bacterium]